MTEIQRARRVHLIRPDSGQVLWSATIVSPPGLLGPFYLQQGGYLVIDDPTNALEPPWQFVEITNDGPLSIADNTIGIDGVLAGRAVLRLPP